MEREREGWRREEIVGGRNEGERERVRERRRIFGKIEVAKY